MKVLKFFEGFWGFPGCFKVFGGFQVFGFCFLLKKCFLEFSREDTVLERNTQWKWKHYLWHEWNTRMS